MNIIKSAIDISFSFALFVNAMLFIPQALKIVRQKTAAAISLSTFFGFLIIQFTAVLYGFMHHDYILVYGYLMSMLTCGSVVGLTLFYESSNSGQAILEGIQVELNTIERVMAMMPGNVYWVDRNSVYMGCNDNQARASGLKDRHEIIGKRNADLPWNFEAGSLPDDLDKVNMNVMKTGQPMVIEEPATLADGSKLIYLSSKVPLRNERHEVVGMVGISVDITQQKQAEIAKDNFMSNMEHDLRTPFAGIGGVADLLYSMYSEKYPELHELLKIMTQSCIQWQEVHNRIFDALDVQQTLKIECFYIQDEMEKMKDLMGATSKMKQIKFNLSYPSHEKTGPIETDLLKFKLILSSLVGNAINFTKAGSVTLQLEYNQTDFILNIIDTGIGIAQDKLESIFEKFTKLSRSNTYGEKFQGMGLGLYNARKDAGKIQASITVKSELGKGSTFTLRLPTKMKCT